MNYSKFITRLSANRKPSLIREMSRPMPPEMIPLTAGKPNPDVFPLTRATFETYDGKKFILDGERMKDALQYHPTQGIPDLVEWLRGLQNQVHHPPNDDFDLVVTTGSQDGLCKALEMSMEEGASVVLEQFVYSGTLAILNPYNPNYVVIESDSDGMKPDSLRRILNKKPTPSPKILYINPTGSNPTGTNLPSERRRQIYEIACENDLLILEDDPYYYLQFTKEKVQSFFSMDTEGRVLRFDSFSKVLSSGIRLGFVTGPKPLTERIMLHMQVSVLHAPSLSQVIASDLLRKWGIDGFFEHVNMIETFYRRRRDAMVDSAERHLSGLVEWTLPGGGMFLWLKTPGIHDTWRLIMEKATKENVLLLPGKAFVPGGGDSSYLRASFSIIDEADIDNAFERLAKVIRRELQ